MLAADVMASRGIVSVLRIGRGKKRRRTPRSALTGVRAAQREQRALPPGIVALIGLEHGLRPFPDACRIGECKR
jgi:hypothetical protein